MSHAERLAAGVQEIALERIPWRESHGVQEQMQLAKFLSHAGEHARDFVVFGDVARREHRVRPERAGQLFDIFLQPLSLISEGESCARFVPGLSDSPGDGAFVGDAEDDSKFSSEKRHSFFVSRFSSRGKGWARQGITRLEA